MCCRSKFMSTGAEITTGLLSWLTIVGLFAALVLIAVLIFPKSEWSRKTFNLVSKHGLNFAFVIALTATSSSLYYSEVVGFAPCFLCWLQRIFLFPQTIILGMAASKKDKTIAPYSLALSIIGGSIAIYHYIEQMSGRTFLPCPVAGPACVQRFFVEFGFVTIPLMSATVFLLLALIMIFLSRRSLTMLQS